MLDFFPGGADERQYCSPGFNLPVASVMRSMYGTYPEYHTSLDNRDLTTPAALRDSIDVYEQILRVLDANRSYVSRVPMCEPQLGSRGLYDTFGVRDRSAAKNALLWLLNYADGEHDLLKVAAMSGIALGELASAGAACCDAGLVAEAVP